MLAAFVTKFDSLTAGLSSSASLSSLGGSGSTPPRVAAAPKPPLARLPPIAESPMRMDLGGLRAEPSLLEEKWDGVGGMSFDDESFEGDRALGSSSPKRVQNNGKQVESPMRGILEGKENLPA